MRTSETRRTSKPAAFSDRLVWRNRLLYCVLVLMVVYMILVSEMGLGDSRMMTPLAEFASRAIFFGSMIWIITVIIRNRRTLQNLIRLKEKALTENDEMNQSLRDKSGGTAWIIVTILQLIITHVASLSSMPAFYVSFTTLMVLLLVKAGLLLFHRFGNHEKYSLTGIRLGFAGCVLAVIACIVFYFFPMKPSDIGKDADSISIVVTELGVDNGSPVNQSTVYDHISETDQAAIFSQIRCYSYSRTLLTLFSDGTIRQPGSFVLTIHTVDGQDSRVSAVIASNDQYACRGKCYRMKNAEALIENILAILHF